MFDCLLVCLLACLTLSLCIYLSVMNSKGFIAEGHSINRPPFFNGLDYSYWKNRMQVFLRAQNYEIWKVVEAGPYENQGEEET